MHVLNANFHNAVTACRVRVTLAITYLDEGPLYLFQLIEWRKQKKASLSGYR